MPAQYIEDLATLIREVVNDVSDDNDELYAAYALLALAKGADVTPADVHDAWASVHDEPSNTDGYLVPFDELPEEIQRRDERYADAIRAVAQRHRPDTKRSGSGL